ncbi:MAG TPA: hypothetical protein VGM56_08405 [Byssovorax sp.]
MASALACACGPAATTEVEIARVAAPVVATSASPAGATARAPSSACAPRCIEGSDVADTAENREVVALVEAYAAGLRTRDAGAVLALASRAYADDAGTPDPSDDLDYAGLAGYLTDTFAKLASLEVEARVTRVRVDANKRVIVDVSIAATYTFSAAPTKPQQQPRRDQVIVLAREGGALRAASGL